MGVWEDQYAQRGHGHGRDEDPLKRKEKEHGQGSPHTLTVTSYDIAGITFVKMQGSLASTTAATGNEEMKKILDKGAKKIVINLADLDYMSSAGLRVFLLTSKLLGNVQGAMKISAAKGMVKEALETSGFNALIQLCTTDDEAMAAFTG